jgi:membrane protein
MSVAAALLSPRRIAAGARRARDVLRAAVARWMEVRAPSLGASLAYYTIFSIAPLLILVIAIAGFVFGEKAAEGALVEQISDLVGAEGAAALQAMIRNAGTRGSGIIATAIGLATLLVAATAVLAELQSSLNVICRASSRGRGLWPLFKARVAALSLIIAIGFLLTVSLAMSAALHAGSAWLDDVVPGLPKVLKIVDLVLSIGFVTFLFALIFKILPDATIEWRDVLLGAVVTALLFTFGKSLISLYLGSSKIATTYGAAAAVVILLVWVYYASQILFFGAALTQACREDRLARQGAAVPDASTAAGGA